MLASLRPSELGYYWALWCTDPWGEQRADLRAGIVTSTIANVNRDPKKKPAPYKARDFMPYRIEEPQRDQAELKKRILAAFGVKLDPKKIRSKQGK